MLSGEFVVANNDWLLYTSETRVHGGNDGYADDPAVSYQWDDTVAHHAELQQGDRVVLLGWEPTSWGFGD